VTTIPSSCAAGSARTGGLADEGHGTPLHHRDQRPIGQVGLDHISSRSGLVGEHLTPSLPVVVHMDDDLRTAVSTMFAYDVT